MLRQASRHPAVASNKQDLAALPFEVSTLSTTSRGLDVYLPMLLVPVSLVCLHYKVCFAVMIFLQNETACRCWRKSPQSCHLARRFGFSVYRSELPCLR